MIGKNLVIFWPKKQSIPPNGKPCYARTMFQKILRVDHEKVCCVILCHIELVIQNVYDQLKRYIPVNYELAKSKSYRL